MSNIIEAKDLCKSYSTFKLKDVSFGVPQGFITGFIGPNGAGKTTTLKILLDVVNADSGNVNSLVKKEDIGVVMDGTMYVDDWKVSEVERAVSPFYRDWDKQTFAKYAKKFNLDMNKKVKDLSKGMKVKLQIAVALSHNAKLLLLDEPTSGLDPVARDEICDLLREFVSEEDKSVLFSTHITSDLEKTADYITFILNGSIVYTGTKTDLLEKYARITGGLSDISADQKKSIIGFREHKTGFEGMIESSKSGNFSKEVLIEEIDLEEIIIFMNKEDVS